MAFYSFLTPIGKRREFMYLKVGFYLDILHYISLVFPAASPVPRIPMVKKKQIIPVVSEPFQFKQTKNQIFPLHNISIHLFHKASKRRQAKIVFCLVGESEKLNGMPILILAEV